MQVEKFQRRNISRVILGAFADLQGLFSGNRQPVERILESFLQERCFRDPDATVGSLELYYTFVEWCHKNGFSKNDLPRRRFGGLMRASGFEKIKSGTYRYSGIGILPG